MSLIRSVKVSLLEIMIYIFHYPRNSMSAIIHSKLLISNTQIFGFPQSIRMGIQASHSSLCLGSCIRRVRTIGPASLTPNILKWTCPYLARYSKYFPTDVLPILRPSDGYPNLCVLSALDTIASTTCP
jgi:hypothetical protein